MNDKSLRPFGVKDQLGYVFGDMAGSFVNLFVDAYFLTFCTYVLGISPEWMAGLFLAARLWDAINDPIMGSFPDRWRLGKSGDKFKPWVKLFMIPLALSGILCFANVPFEGIALHSWVAFAYVFYGMSYTGTSMPFGAMASVVSADPIDRSKLSRARSIGGTIVGMGALSLVPIFCFDKDSNIIPERFTLIAVIFGVLCIISYLLLCNLTVERVRQPKQEGEKFNYGNVLKAAVHNRPLIGVMVATIGSMLYITGSSQLRSYIYKEFYQDTSMMTLASIGTFPIMLICFILVPKICTEIWKEKCNPGYEHLQPAAFRLHFTVPSSERTALHRFKPVGYHRPDCFYHLNLGSGYRLSGLQRMENEFPRRWKYVQSLYVQP